MLIALQGTLGLQQ